MSRFFDGLGIKLFDGLPAIPTCCRASGNGNWADMGKGFLCDERITGYALWIEGAAPRDRRPLDGHDPYRTFAGRQRSRGPIVEAKKWIAVTD
jgi:hypothetical protein